MKTALITGASEGIGYEFARIFAKNGFNLVLVARNEERLKTIQKELAVYKIDIQYYAKDLSILGNAEFIYQDLNKRNIKIEYLVNNAGFGIKGEITALNWERELQMLNLNIVTLTYFTKVFAQSMVANGFGRIINVASTGSFQPGPFMAEYCATKAYVLNFSEAVNFEIKSKNVTVTTLCPGVTDTKFHQVAETEETFMSKFLSHATAEEVARYGYKIMMKGKSLGVYGMANKLVVFMNRFSSRKMSTFVAGKLLK